MISLGPERGLLGVRMEVAAAAVSNLRHPGLSEPQVARQPLLDAAHRGDGLRQHVLPLILVVHVHSGEEHTAQLLMTRKNDFINTFFIFV